MMGGASTRADTEGRARSPGGGDTSLDLQERMEVGREKSLSGMGKGLDVRERESITFEEMKVYWGPLVDYEGGVS